MKNYISLSAHEVAEALCITDCDEISGGQIAQEMLNGLIHFTYNELQKLANYKKVPFDFILQNDFSLLHHKIYYEND